MSDIEAKAGIVRRHITVALTKSKLFVVFHKSGNNGVELCDECFKKLNYLLEKTLAMDTIKEEKKE